MTSEVAFSPNLSTLSGAGQVGCAPAPPPNAALHFARCCPPAAAITSCACCSNCTIQMAPGTSPATSCSAWARPAVAWLVRPRPSPNPCATPQVRQQLASSPPPVRGQHANPPPVREVSSVHHQYTTSTPPVRKQCCASVASARSPKLLSAALASRPSTSYPLPLFGLTPRVLLHCV